MCIIIVVQLTKMSLSLPVIPLLWLSETLLRRVQDEEFLQQHQDFFPHVQDEEFLQQHQDFFPHVQDEEFLQQPKDFFPHVHDEEFLQQPQDFFPHVPSNKVKFYPPPGLPLHGLTSQELEELSRDVVASSRLSSSELDTLKMSSELPLYIWMTPSVLSHHRSLHTLF